MSRAILDVRGPGYSHPTRQVMVGLHVDTTVVVLDVGWNNGDVNRHILDLSADEAEALADLLRINAREARRQEERRR